MKIQNNNPNQSFGQLYVNSHEAVKLLRKADRAIKASNANFVNTNIPKGHKRPLWSVLSEHITQRQRNNPNNIIIEIASKAKQLLFVKTVDEKGFLVSKYEVNPMPQYGTHNDLFPTDDLYRRYYHSLDTKLYGRSNLYDILDRAEYEVDMLHQKQLEEMPEIQISIRTLPKENKKERKAGVILNPKRPEKAKRKIHDHLQKPFENVKELIELKQKLLKFEAEQKTNLRKKAKSLNKNGHKQKISASNSAES